MKHGSIHTQKMSKGFTLVELITVVAIVSLLVVYITIRLSSSNEDAKVALASTFILGKVPTVISAYKARHMNSCTGLPSDTDGADALRQELISRGLIGTTPWDEEWSAVYDNEERRLLIVFPTQGMENPLLATTDIVQNIFDAPQIDSLVIDEGADAVGYDDIPVDGSTGARTEPPVPGGLDRSGSIQIWYDCI